MRQLDGHLHLAHRLWVSNVWLFVDEDGRRWLIDTGHPLERPWLVRALRRAGVAGPGDLAGILLTHRHSDHAGNAAFLRDKLRAPVYCHAADAPLLAGDAALPPLARGRAAWYEEALCRIEDRWPARCAVDGTWDEGAWRPGWEAVPVPGHTEGSSLLYHAPTATLFTGDAILAGIPPFRLVEILRLARPGFSLEVERCHAAVRRFLADLPPVRAVCAGHGPPVLDGAEAKLRRLAAPRR